MAVTIRSGDIVFNDGTTQSTAASAVPSSISAVGAVVFAAINTTSSLKPGDTVAGSAVHILTSITYTYTVQGTVNSEGTTTTPITQWVLSGMNNTARRRTVGNTGYTTPGGTTTQSGTWRLLTPCSARYSGYDSTYNYTDALTYGAIVQRIS